MSSILSLNFGEILCLVSNFKNLTISEIHDVITPIRAYLSHFWWYSSLEYLQLPSLGVVVWWSGCYRKQKLRTEQLSVMCFIQKLHILWFHIDPLSVMIHFNLNLSKLNTIGFSFFTLLLFFCSTTSYHMPLSVIFYFFKLLTISRENLNHVDQCLLFHISILNVTSLSFPCYS